MKSERRHELQHNELADWLAKTAKTIKPYQNMAMAAVALVLIVIVGYTLWSRESTAQTTQAWDELNVALETVQTTRNLEPLSKVIEDYPDTNVAYTAKAVLADLHLGTGCDRLFENKARAQEELNKAIASYEAVLKGSRTPDLQERATFGLARAKESKGDAESLAQAEKLYKNVVAKWPKGAYAVAAQQRAKDLERPTTKRFYDDFRNFDPKPSFSAEPGDRPDFDLNSLPNDGSAYLPETTNEPKTDSQGKEEGKAEEKKPAEDAK
jgi:predicted negative regulator of RcsB-dependent stress response